MMTPDMASPAPASTAANILTNLIFQIIRPFPEVLIVKMSTMTSEIGMCIGPMHATRIRHTRRIRMQTDIVKRFFFI